MKSGAKCRRVFNMLLLLLNKLRQLGRGLFFLLVTLLVTAGSAFSIVCFHKLPYGKKLVRGIERLWAWLVTWASGVKVEARLTRLDPAKNYLFLANHQSYLDIPLLLNVFSRFAPRFVAKEELFKIPLFGSGMASSGHIAVDRDNPKRAMRDMQVAEHLAKHGESIWIFPEGTRNNTDAPVQDFHMGAFILAIKTGLPVVPVAVSGTKEILSRGKLLIRPGKVVVEALEPLDITGYTMKDREQLKEKVWQIMYHNLLELRNDGNG